jgi:hypothetical protein
MSFIKNITTKFIRRNEKITNSFQFDDALSQLSHDIKNNFIAIRSIIGNLKKNLSHMEKDAIDIKLKNINKIIDYATVHIEMTRTLFSPIENYPSAITNFSILSCIQEAIQNYPFPSQKCITHITVLKPEMDFQVIANKHLTIHILFCLIKNIVNTIYSLEHAQATIALTKESRNSIICFRIPNTTLDEKNHFSLGLPENIGGGLKFIQGAMASMGGSIIFETDTNDHFLVSLIFRCE